MSYFELHNGEKIYYEDRGSGSETLVMMHGWTSSHEVFSEPAGRLSQIARCITYDHRGHGGSKQANSEVVTLKTLASDLNELITGLELDRVTLLGWSMGAAVAMTYMHEYGCGALKQVILCDMTPKQMNDDDWNLGLYQGRYRAEDKSAMAGQDFFSLFKKFAISAMPKLKKYPKFLLDLGLKKELEKCDERILITLSASMSVMDNRDVIRGMTVPLTYFYADPGSIYSPGLKDWYRDNVTTEFHSVEFTGCTHMLVAEAPDLFAREVEKVLKRS